MMARALVVHWLFSPASVRGHPSSVVSMRFASSCVENQGGCMTVRLMKQNGNIPFSFGETGSVVI